jgi:hypothetical protein
MAGTEWLYRGAADRPGWAALPAGPAWPHWTDVDTGMQRRCLLPAGAAPLPTCPVGLEAVPLQATLVIDGPAVNQPARWLYVVETNVLPEVEADFNDWYSHEHLPGLAAVPGVVQARRLLRGDGRGARYHACYLLAERAAFNSPPWLAVRATPWSSRVRPAFRDTHRTLFQAGPQA